MASLTSGVRVHETARMRSAWKHSQEGADSVTRNGYVPTDRADGQTELRQTYTVIGPDPDSDGCTSPSLSGHPCSFPEAGCYFAQCLKCSRLSLSRENGIRRFLCLLVVEIAAMSRACTIFRSGGLEV